MTEPRGRTSWKPNARTRALAADIHAVLAEYRDYLPVTGRQVYYRLIGQYGLPKGARQARAVGRLLVCMRRTTNPEFHVPFDAIRDDGSVSKGGDVDHTPEDFWREVATSAETYRRNHQAGQPQRLEVWCEAAGMVDQLWDAVWQRDIGVESGGGKDSLTLKYERARRIAVRSGNQPTVVLYLGDQDPDGREMFQALTEDVPLLHPPASRHVRFVRVALTEDQIARYDLDEDPEQPGAYQVEALSPAQIRAELLAVVDRFWDQPAEDRVIAQEERERAEIMRRVRELTA